MRIDGILATLTAWESAWENWRTPTGDRSRNKERALCCESWDDGKACSYEQEGIGKGAEWETRGQLWSNEAGWWPLCSTIPSSNDYVGSSMHRRMNVTGK
jgi:hypothetical protein